MEISFYFLVFIIIGSFFLLNLFIGVIFLNFNKSQKFDNSNIMITKNQAKWIEMQKFILRTKPEYKNVKIPTSKFQLEMYKATKHLYFEVFIMGCIFSNIIVLSLPYEGASKNYLQYLELMNYCFNVIFIFEMICKVIGSGFRGYLYNKWNRFDIIVVFCSILDFILIIIGKNIPFIIKFPQLIRILRILRVLKIVRLVRKFNGMINLIQTLIFSLPSVINIGALLFLFLFIFSILGCFMFGNITSGKIVNDDDINFKNFINAILLLIRCMTGEDWPIIMFDLYKFHSLKFKIILKIFVFKNYCFHFLLKN